MQVGHQFLQHALLLCLRRWFKTLEPFELPGLGGVPVPLLRALPAPGGGVEFFLLCGLDGGAKLERLLALILRAGTTLET